MAETPQHERLEFVHCRHLPARVELPTGHRARVSPELFERSVRMLRLLVRLLLDDQVGEDVSDPPREQLQRRHELRRAVRGRLLLEAEYPLELGAEKRKFAV